MPLAYLLIAWVPISERNSAADREASCPCNKPLRNVQSIRSMTTCRSVFPALRDRAKLLCEEVKKREGKPLDVQDAMQRLALDMIMLAAFNMDTHAVDFRESVILDSLHYCFNDIFRCGCGGHIQCPVHQPALQQGGQSD